MHPRTTVHRAHRLGLVAVAGAITFSLVACGAENAPAPGASEAPQQQSVELKVGLTHSTASIFYQTMEEIAERVADRTDGRVTLSIFPDSQLGSNEEVMEQALSGAPTVAGMNASSASAMGGVPEFLILGSAYVLPEAGAIEPFVASDLYQGWLQRLEANDFIVLAGNWINGRRHIISTDPNGYKEPDDLAGVTIRVPPGRQFATFFDATPALGVQLDPSETYTGLEQGTVDAADGPLTQMRDWGLTEVGKSVTLTAHIIEPVGWSMGGAVWKTISPEDQQVLREEFARGGRDFTARMLDAEQTLRAEFEAEGIQFIDPDIEQYRRIAEEAVMSSPEAAEWPDDLFSQVNAAMGLGD